ncbi:FkbM family methyltransferase [Mesorhizobium sp. B2-5-3]|uniref:FkbM family methyltransferase n=1 Tax=Mesorhizobium sp. B2-5-3 TaxID=2589927 RepID=UPI00112E4F5F|nr:FkbM family methyltransferase [Mesorhizobium sp. B2-5-3]TPK31702.1 FkbM family methyltransferase [Mesorhizobium sp. B2-5-3]
MFSFLKLSKVERMASKRNRLQQFIEARAVLGDDFFGGWEEQDARLFANYTVQSAPEAGKIIDYFGVRTSAHLHPWASHMSGSVHVLPPIPDDQLRAEAIEYFATLDALERAPSNSFTMAEFGASYAPWACFSAVLAKRSARKNISITAVEASKYLFGLIEGHLAENGISGHSADIRLVNGAVATGRCTLYFPKVASAAENGGRTENGTVAVDYLGRVVEHEEVQGYPVSDLLPEGVTDLIHVDIQGMEGDVLSSAIDVLNEKVRCIFVGTHSRKIEGELLELFHANAWTLVRERPTRFNYTKDRKEITGWTTRDGGQYWLNPRIK